MKVTRSKDFWAGLMFIAFGVGFILVARDYAIGSAVRMGPAYFPTVLGGLLTLLGLAIGGRAFVAAGAAVGRFALRPAILVVLSVVLFALALRPLGLVAATAILIFVGAFGGSEFRWWEVAVLYLVLIVFSVAAFYHGLGLPFQLWPAFVGR
ncbi:MAG: tripartite tricarboxylate transporter TctB family protein [Burkholderiales bacterium]|nr:tripartite tricarboxylate transporter TctB family protein [Burkholderiales bacterium]